MRLALFAAPVALALAAAIGRAGDPGGAAGARDGPGVSPAGPESLRLELLLPPRVRAGERVPIRLRAQNATQHTLDLYLRGRAPTFDVVIARADGEVVWQRLEGEIIPAIVHLRPLAPGERLEIGAAWDQRTKAGKTVGPGEYVAYGLLLVEGEPLRTPSASLRIAPPARHRHEVGGS